MAYSSNYQTLVEGGLFSYLPLEEALRHIGHSFLHLPSQGKIHPFNLDFLSDTESRLPLVVQEARAVF